MELDLLQGIGYPTRQEAELVGEQSPLPDGEPMPIRTTTASRVLVFANVRLRQERAQDVPDFETIRMLKGFRKDLIELMSSSAERLVN